MSVKRVVRRVASPFGGETVLMVLWGASKEPKSHKGRSRVINHNTVKPLTKKKTRRYARQDGATCAQKP